MLPHNTTWNDLIIEHHRQPAAECELRLPQHTICILLSECRIERRVDGGPLRQNQARNGEIIVYPAGSEHWIRWREQSEFMLLFLDTSLVAQKASELDLFSSVELIESEKEMSDPLMQQLALTLETEIKEGMNASSPLYVESLVNTLSAHLLRHYAVWKPKVRDVPVRHSSMTLRHVTEYIHDNLDHQLTLGELALITGMSTYHFARTFKQVTGVTPHQYVLNARVERAKRLLLQGKLSIAEIANRVGFFDQSHLTRSFKRLVGVTPQTLLHQGRKNIPE
jgi:AraC family transcriptional regulator